MWLKDSITGSDKIDGTIAFTSTGGTYFSYMEIETGMTSAKSGYVSANRLVLVDTNPMYSVFEEEAGRKFPGTLSQYIVFVSVLLFPDSSQDGIISFGG